MAGLIHLYCGDGKGKTSAAVGLAVRASGAGKRVIFTQFFKDGTSSEFHALKKIENIRIIHCKTVRGLWKRMDDQQKAQAAKDYTNLFSDVISAAQEADLLVLDEILSACNHGAVAEELVTDFLRHKPEKLEVVLSGRNPSPAFLELADYITEMKKIRHPYDAGIPARKGIEF